MSGMRLGTTGEDAWCKCKTCGLHFTGAMQLALARAWVARTADGPLDVAVDDDVCNLANALQKKGIAIQNPIQNGGSVRAILFVIILQIFTKI